MMRRAAALHVLCIAAWSFSACARTGTGTGDTDTATDDDASLCASDCDQATDCADLVTTLNVSLESLSFVPTTTSYTLEVELLTSELVIVAESRADAELRLDGLVVASGEAVTVGLDLGDTVITVEATAGSCSVTYTLTVTRGRDVYLKASNAGSADVLGNAIALDGDTLVVAAYSEDGSASSTAAVPDDALSSAGAVYVFVRSGTAWSQQAYLKASNASTEDYFGYSVAVSGDTLAVSAPYEDGSASSTATAPDDSVDKAGAVYLFVRSGTAWSQQAYLKASNAGVSDQFGRSVAMDGDTVAVGASCEGGDANSTVATPNDNATCAGAVYIFVRSGTVWSQQAYLKASNAQVSDYLGDKLTLDDDTLAAAAPGEDGSAGYTAATSTDDQSEAGAVYVFVRSGTAWSEQAYLKASNASVNDHFGSAVTLDGGTLAVGAYNEDGSASSSTTVPDDSAESAGAVYVFVRNGTAWSQQAYLKASNAGTGDYFGRTVAVRGDTLAVGAYGENGSASSTAAAVDENASDAGAVYVFTRSGTAWSQQVYLKATNADAEDWFGNAIALDAGTLAVGACYESGSASSTAEAPNDATPDAGAVYVYTL